MRKNSFLQFMEEINKSSFELIVKQLGEPTMVSPAEETQKGPYFLSNIDLSLLLKLQVVYCFKTKAREKEKEKENGSDKSVEVIKEALSKVLVHYYPMAGRLKIGSGGRIVVDCTGEGVVFVEAEANCSIQDILIDNNTKRDGVINPAKLVYDLGSAENLLDLPLLSVQVTKFKCGGFVLGICLNHCMADGIASMQFMKSWGDIAQGLHLKFPPFLDRTLLKARNSPKIEFTHHQFTTIEDISNTDDLNEEEFLYKSLYVSPEKLEQLKMEVMEDGVLAACTTFEALTAFVWKSRSQALKFKNDQQTKLQFVVDGRSRVDPPLPYNYFGNGIVATGSLCSAGKLVNSPMSFAVGLVQEAIKMVTDSYIRSAIDHLEVTRYIRAVNVPTLGISSWSRLSLHSTNFGWGEPVLPEPVSLPGKQAALFISNGNERNGIFVFLGLPASSMKIFQELIEKQEPLISKNKL